MGKNGQRLVSLDVLRGITVAGMILVNNSGGGESYQLLRHAAWNGLSLSDLVFPFFLFIMGVSTYLSLNKSEFKLTAPLALKILKRTLMLILIGWAVTWFDHACWGDSLSLSKLRFTGVLPRIGICYCIVSFIAVLIPHRWLPYITGIILAGYACLLWLGNGYSPDESNIIVKIDRMILGEAHLYLKKPVDPEGLISTLPAIAHTLIGFLCGKLLMNGKPVEKKVVDMFAIGFVLMAAGFMLTDFLPLNKRIWSPTFACVTCGLAMMLLAFLTKVIDMDGHDRWCRFFLVFGVNPLFLYVLSEVFAIVFGVFDITMVWYNSIHYIISDACLASLVFAISFTLMHWAIGYPLYRRKIYIKL